VIVSDNTLTVGESFSLWGSGFTIGEPVIVALWIDESVRPILTNTTANGAGAFTIDFSGLGLKPAIADRAVGGVRTIVAIGADGSKASAPVHIVASEIVANNNTSLAATASATDGTSTVVGGGFHAGEGVAVAVKGVLPDGSDKVIVGGNANDNGAFSFDVNMAKITLDAGTYTLTASGNKGSIATAAFVVTEADK